MVVKKWSRNIAGIWFNFSMVWNKGFVLRLGFKIDIVKHYDYIFHKDAKFIFIDLRIYFMNLTLHFNINWEYGR